MATPLRLLILEDSASDAELVLHTLRRAGFDPSADRVETEGDFREQLQREPEIILADFSMPQFDSLRALEILQECRLDIPFIIVSGTIGEERAVQAMQRGATEYIIKDRLGRLGLAIQQALARGKLKGEKLKAEQTVARLAAIVESSSDAIIAQELEGVITSWNAAAERLYGYAPEEILGKNGSVLVPRDQRRTDFPENYQEITQSLARGEQVPPYTALRVRKDGCRIEVLLSNSPLFDADGNLEGVSTIAHDVTQRKRNQRLRNAELAITGILTASIHLAEAVPRILQSLAESLRWEVAVFWTVDAKANVLRRLCIWHAPWAETSFLDMLSQKHLLEPGSGVAGRAWNTGQPACEPGFQTDAQATESAALAPEGMRCGFGLPMRHGMEMAGVIEFYNREMRELDPALIATLDNIACQISQFCERCRIEAALRASEEQLRQLADAMPQIVWTARPDGVAVYLNERGYRFADHAKDGNPEQTLRSILHPDDGERTLDRWTQSVRSGAPFEIEVRLIEGKSKRARWFLVRAIAATDVAGAVTHWFGTCTDIDNQKKVLEDLRSSEERFRKLVLALPAAVYTTDQTGRITLFNEHAVELWGQRPELGQDRWCGSWKMFRTDGTPLPHAECPMAVTLRQGRGVRGEEIIVERPDGSRAHVLPHPEPLYGATGEISGAVNMLVDLTQMKLLEEQFRQAQKMEAVGRLAGGVAHDFNNLLTIINGYSEILLSTLQADDRNRTMIQEILHSGQRATALTSQLLAFSRQQILCPQVFCLNTVLADTEKMLCRLIGEDVELNALPAPALGNVRADPSQMEQILLNLAVNARDAMPRGGRFTLSTENVVLTPELLVGHPELASGPYVLLSASDNGCGMDPRVLSRIFEPFFTTKGTKGTGLGLSTVFGIVKQSQGFIEVSSAPGQGTTFKIYFPRVAEPVASLKPTPPTPARLHGSETILLAEDEEGVRKLTRLILQTNGYTVLEAASAAEAMHIFEQQGESIDMLITDVVMPHMSGRELADQLVAKRPAVKVLYLSGYTDDTVVLHGVYHEQAHFLQKPFNSTGLTMKVRDMFNAPCEAAVK